MGYYSGSGWGINYYPAGYGLTYAGIEYAASLNEIDVKVCSTSTELLNAYQAIESNSSVAIITDSGLLELENDSSCTYHAVLALCQKVDDVFRLFVMDSFCSSRFCHSYFRFETTLEHFKKQVGIGKLEVYISEVARQRDEHPICYAFALEGVRAYQKNNKLLDTLRASAVQSKIASRYEIHRLPDQLLIESDDICKRAVRYQQDVIDAVIAENNTERLRELKLEDGCTLQ